MPRIANQKNHGISFEEARELFTSRVDSLEIFDEAHSELEDRSSPLDRSAADSTSSSGPSVTKTASGSSAHGWATRAEQTLFRDYLRDTHE
jgi:hypothetical protein